MTPAINSHKLHAFLKEPFVIPSADVLRRQGAVFFIGGNLPVLEALETMYESHCQESTGLFHVAFGELDALSANLEMVRQIKKNFSVRLMGQINYKLPEAFFEHLYLAGLDLLDIPWAVISGNTHLTAYGRTAQSAASFPRWSLVSSLSATDMAPGAVREAIDTLLDNGIIPLLGITRKLEAVDSDSVEALFAYQVDAWQRHEVPLKPLLPLIRLISPLEAVENTGLFRSVLDRFQDRGKMVSSDLRRHLRTSGAEASFESAGL